MNSYLSAFRQSPFDELHSKKEAHWPRSFILHSQHRSTTPWPETIVLYGQPHRYQCSWRDGTLPSDEGVSLWCCGRGISERSHYFVLAPLRRSTHLCYLRHAVLLNDTHSNLACSAIRFKNFVTSTSYEIFGFILNSSDIVIAEHATTRVSFLNDRSFARTPALSLQLASLKCASFKKLDKTRNVRTEPYRRVQMAAVMGAFR